MNRIAIDKSKMPPPHKQRAVSERLKKDIVTLLGEGKVFRASTFKSRPKPIRKRSKEYVGWWDVALEIWAERPHYCEVSGVFLGDEPRPEFFSHLLPRSSYPRFKRDKRNIRLKSMAMHNLWHEYGPNTLQRYPEWIKTCDLYFQLRNIANGIEQEG